MRARIIGGPSAGQVDPGSAASPIDRNCGVDMFVTRAQVDFLSLRLSAGLDPVHVSPA